MRIKCVYFCCEAERLDKKNWKLKVLFSIGTAASTTSISAEATKSRYRGIRK